MGLNNMKKLNIVLGKLKENSWYKQVFSDNTLYFFMQGKNRSNGNPIGIIIDPSRRNISTKNILNENLWEQSSKDEVKRKISSSLWENFLIKIR
jgi:hypothetical protein